MSENPSTSNNSDNYQQLNLNDFVLLNLIGEGSFGNVYQIKEKKTGEIYAAKISHNKIYEYSSDVLKNLIREINIISKLHHPAVLKFKGYSLVNFKNNFKPVIIMEYVPNGTLEDYIHHKSSFNNSTRKLVIIYGIASAMSYLHSHNIIHRDLKPANILITKLFYPKIADFGLSKSKQTNFESMTVNSMIGTVKGTPLYMAPEIWRKSEYSKASDVYAFAIIVYEIITNKKPFENFNIFDIQIKISNGYRPVFPDDTPKVYQDLITSCWAEDPSSRPTFDEILNKLKNDLRFFEGPVDKDIDKYVFINREVKFENLVDRNIFLTYIHYFDYDINYSKSNTISLNFVIDSLEKNKVIVKPITNISYFKEKIHHFPYRQYIELDQSCKELVNKAENDPQKQFIVAKCLIEGQELFPLNTELGIKYLKESMKSDNIESALYYCKIYINGCIVHSNYKKVKKILEKFIKNKDNGLYYLLQGKMLKKEKKYEEAAELFKKSISCGNAESMYEFGCFLFKRKCFDKSIKYFEKAIKNECVKAMFKYGRILLQGEGITKNEEEGLNYIKMAVDKEYPDALFYYHSNISNDFKYLKKAAYLGHTDSMIKYGLYLYDLNKEDPHFLKDSLFFLQKAADKGQIKSIFLINEIIENQNSMQVIKFERIAAYNGDINAMFKYGQKLLQGVNTEVDIEEGIKFIKKAADCGLSSALNYYGHLLFEGKLIPANKKEAIKYYRMAIEKGNVDSMNNYALMLKNGDGIPVDFNEAEKYFQMAIDRGNDASMYNYAVMLDENDKNIESVVKYLKMAIDKGNMYAMNYYANMLDHGIKIPINKKEAIKYYRMAIEKGNVDSMNNYSLMLKNGDEIPADFNEAEKYFQMAIDRGNDAAMYNYAVMLDENDKNIESVVKYLKMAIDKGNIYAMNYYACMFEYEGNKSEKIKYFKMAIDKGNVTSMYEYAFFLFKDKLNPSNTTEALKYFKIAADQGNKEAMLAYSMILSDGERTTVNLEEAVKYYKMSDFKNDLVIEKYDILKHYYYNIKNPINFIKMAADNGNEFAMLKYASKLNKGKGVTLDLKEAAKYYKMAADKGNTDAIMKYASMIYNGEGVDVDLKEAAKYYKMAADKYNIDAIMKYASMVYNGEGVDVDLKEAAKYYKMAAKKDNKEAILKYASMLSNGEGVLVDKKKAEKYLNKIPSRKVFDFFTNNYEYECKSYSDSDSDFDSVFD